MTSSHGEQVFIQNCDGNEPGFPLGKKWSDFGFGVKKAKCCWLFSNQNGSDPLAHWTGWGIGVFHCARGSPKVFGAMRLNCASSASPSEQPERFARGILILVTNW